MFGVFFCISERGDGVRTRFDLSLEARGRLREKVEDRATLLSTIKTAGHASDDLGVGQAETEVTTVWPRLCAPTVGHLECMFMVAHVSFWGEAPSSGALKCACWGARK